MVKKANEQDIFANQFPDEKEHSSHPWKWGLFACLSVFLISILFTNAYLQRRVLISHIKQQVSYSIASLNQFGWDLAYDNISFHAFPLLPLGELNNVKLYNRYAHSSWNIEKVRFDNSILNPQKLSFDISGKQFVTYDGKAHKISSDNQEVYVEVNDEGGIKLLALKVFNLSIADWADAEQVSIVGKSIAQKSEIIQLPSFETSVEIVNTKLNGLLNYPLSQNIRKIYFNTAVIGKIGFTNNLRSDLREWMSKDGHLEITDFTLNWSPLLLVGRGNLYLNENFNPILRMDTTSKALSVLIADLERKNWLDSKGVFVANILLSSKSYKSDENDEYLTVTTPISIRDDALLIEKIAVKKFNQAR